MLHFGNLGGYFTSEALSAFVKIEDGKVGYLWFDIHDTFIIDVLR